jgi:hypothetical protein
LTLAPTASPTERYPLLSKIFFKSLFALQQRSGQGGSSGDSPPDCSGPLIGQHGVHLNQGGARNDLLKGILAVGDPSDANDGNLESHESSSPLWSGDGVYLALCEDIHLPNEASGEVFERRTAESTFRMSARTFARRQASHLSPWHRLREAMLVVWLLCWRRSCHRSSLGNEATQGGGRDTPSPLCSGREISSQGGGAEEREE